MAGLGHNILIVLPLDKTFVMLAHTLLNDMRSRVTFYYNKACETPDMKENFQDLLCLRPADRVFSTTSTDWSNYGTIIVKDLDVIVNKTDVAYAAAFKNLFR